MAKQQPDLSSVWARIGERVAASSSDIQETRHAAKPAALASFGDVRGNVINIGSISKADLEQLLAARNGVPDEKP